MSSNVRFISVNHADDATLSASPAAVSTLPVTNLQLSPRGKISRFTGLATQDIDGTLPSSRLVSGFVLYRHNLTTSATCRLRLYSDVAMTTLIYDTGAFVALPGKALGELDWGIDPLGASVFTGWGEAFTQLWFTPIKIRAFKITLTDAGNPDGYIDVGRLFLGPFLEPLINIEFGTLQLGWSEGSTQTRTGGGSLRTDSSPAGPYRCLTMSLNGLNEGERSRFVDFQRTTGLRKDFFVSVFPEQGGALERDHAMVGKLVSQDKFTRLTWTQPGVTTFEIEEA